MPSKWRARSSKVFDSQIHQPRVAETQPQATARLGLQREMSDQRWVICSRPVVMAGGEMTLDMLDLQWNTEARFYDAPLHVKAFNGMMLIDDFGRQKFAPNDLLNRWIVPMESQVDFMKLHTGASFTLPFDVLLMFSTNLHPADLMDAAFLRRIQYKIKLFEPTRDEYRQIFSAVARSRGLECSEEVFDYIVRMLTPFGSGVLSAALHLRSRARNVQVIRTATTAHDRAGGRGAGQPLRRY